MLWRKIKQGREIGGALQFSGGCQEAPVTCGQKSEGDEKLCSENTWGSEEGTANVKALRWEHARCVERTVRRPE